MELSGTHEKDTIALEHRYEQKFIQNFEKHELRVPKIHVGLIKNIPDNDFSKKIAFALLDEELYQSIVDSFIKIYHKIQKNGVICIYGYNNPNFPDILKACEYFLDDKPEKETIICENMIGIMVKQ